MLAVITMWWQELQCPMKGEYKTEKMVFFSILLKKCTVASRLKKKCAKVNAATRHWGTFCWSADCQPHRAQYWLKIN